MTEADDTLPLPQRSTQDHVSHPDCKSTPQGYIYIYQFERQDVTLVSLMHSPPGPAQQRMQLRPRQAKRNSVHGCMASSLKIVGGS